jgi:hypothetical protein
MNDFLTRVEGPMWTRLLLQPTVAAILGVRAGLADARHGRPAYLWTVLQNASARHGLLRSGWRDIVRVFVMAVVLDVIYQITVYHSVALGELLFVAFLLAGVPYLLIRGPVNRIATMLGWAAPPPTRHG